MKYLSLYKTSSEHSADNSRLTPNISLITDDKKLILTNENNIDTTFTEVDIIESFDDLINRFPTDNSTSMPGLKIYGDDTRQSNLKDMKLCNDAREWRSNYIQNNGLSDTGQPIRLNVDAVLIDNIIMDKYDGNYKYYINIYNDRIELMNNDGLDIVIVYGDHTHVYAYVVFNNYNIFPSPLETRMPFLAVFSTGNSNYDLYIKAQQWRKDYISYNGLSDTGQPISMFIDKLNIDAAYMDEYDRYYHYHIDIYNDHIILLNNNSEEILTISSDGSVTILDIFNKFPTPSKTSSNMPGVKIYTDNTDQSKEKNIKLYNDAQEWLRIYKLNTGSNSNKNMLIDALVIDDETIDEYDMNSNYNININNDYIMVYPAPGSHPNVYIVIYIHGDGSVKKS